VDFRDSPADAGFRSQVRSFIDAELPEALRHIEPEWGSFNTRRGRGGDSEAGKQWRQKLVAKKWIAPHWPVKYGGAGLDIGQQFIFNEEIALHRAAEQGRLFGLRLEGLWMHVGTPDAIALAENAIRISTR